MRKAVILLTAAISAATLSIAGPAIARDRGPDAGPLTRSDVEARLGDAFSRLDANHDGLLSPADREAKFAERFAKADADGDGQLSLAEASAARDGGREQWRERKADGRKDRDGRRGEGREGRDGLHSLIGMVRSADADGDKQISEAEFNTAALARFDRADADGDGSVTRAERRDAMRAAFGAKPVRFRD
jgi:hypothetical protein